MEFFLFSHHLESLSGRNIYPKITNVYSQKSEIWPVKVKQHFAKQIFTLFGAFFIRFSRKPTTMNEKRVDWHCNGLIKWSQSDHGPFRPLLCIKTPFFTNISGSFDRFGGKFTTFWSETPANWLNLFGKGCADPATTPISLVRNIGGLFLHFFAIKTTFFTTLADLGVKSAGFLLTTLTNWFRSLDTRQKGYHFRINQVIRSTNIHTLHFSGAILVDTVCKLMNPSLLWVSVALYSESSHPRKLTFPSISLHPKCDRSISKQSTDGIQLYIQISIQIHW